MLEWYAKHFGIGDLDIDEADWVADWVKRHHNRLRYDPRTCRWSWNEVGGLEDAAKGYRHHG